VGVGEGPLEAPPQRRHHLGGELGGQVGHRGRRRRRPGHGGREVGTGGGGGGERREGDGLVALDVVLGRRQHVGRLGGALGRRERGQELVLLVGQLPLDAPGQVPLEVGDGGIAALDELGGGI